MAAKSMGTPALLHFLHWPTVGILVLLVWPVLLFGQRSNSAAAADVIYMHGEILTGGGLLSDTPQRASALATEDGLVIAIGSNAAVMTLRGQDTAVIDLKGAFVVPGFNDAHVHLASAGREKLTIDLVGIKSLAEMQQSITEAAKSAVPGTWLRGRGWDHMLWASKKLPSRQDLDAFTGDHPAIFTRVDGHIAVANSKALQLADIVAKTLNPSGGQIDRDSSGQPTGIVRETAVDLVYAKVPPPTHEERRHALALAIQDAAAHGITSLQDYSTWDDFLAFEEMERENKLPVRVSEWLTFLDPLAVLEQQRAHHSADDPMLHTGMLKGFMDGSLGSRTAALNAPYSDDPGNIGIPQFDQATLNRMTIERAQAGFQIGFHAIGDRGVKMALDAFVAAEAALPNSMTYRCRIEHDQVVDPKDFARYKWLGVIASMQPNHLLTDMYWAEDRIGAQRAKYSYPWKTFWNQGTVLAFGTDYPVEPVTPFRGIYAAVTRKSEDGTRIYHPEQALTINQALYAYTQASAFAEHMETKKGKLLPGQFADFVVLDRDLLKATPADILKTQVLRTVVAGRTVFEADTPASPKPTGTSQPCALLNEGTYDVEKSSKSQPKRAKLVASTTGEIRCLLPANLIAGNAYWRNRWREQTVEQNSPPECRRLHRSVSGSVDGIPRQYSEDADPSHCGRTKHPVSPSGRSEVSER